MDNNPVYVVGAQRSGTTVLGLLLSKHRDIFMTVHGKLLYYLIVWIYNDFSQATQFHPRLDEIIFSLNRRPILGIGESDKEKMFSLLSNKFYLRDFDNMTKEEIISYIWTSIYRELSCNKEILGDKYNEYLLQLTQIIRIFPKARFIFIHRNYNDVAESMVRHFAGRVLCPETYEDAVIKWAQWNLNWLNFREKLLPDHRLEISYSDMITNPRKIFSDICEFLQIPFYDEYAEIVDNTIINKNIESSLKMEIDYASIERVFPKFWEVVRVLNY